MRWVHARIFPASDAVCTPRQHGAIVRSFFSSREKTSMVRRTCNSEDDASGSFSSSSSSRGGGHALNAPPIVSGSDILRSFPLCEVLIPPFAERMIGRQPLLDRVTTRRVQVGGPGAFRSATPRARDGFPVKRCRGRKSPRRRGTVGCCGGSERAVKQQRGASRSGERRRATRSRAQRRQVPAQQAQSLNR